VVQLDARAGQHVGVAGVGVAVDTSLIDSEVPAPINQSSIAYGECQSFQNIAK
jgi:hypothetical protein